MNTKSPARPMPHPTPTTQPFWDGASVGKLMMQYDPESDAYQFWPRANSVRTGKRNLEWREVSGKGTLYSFTLTHVPTPGFADKAPYPIGLVELDEGVRIIGNLLNVAPDDLKVGMPLQVTWEKLSDEITYFAFEPQAG